jgi:uncharacterized protein YbcI
MATDERVRKGEILAVVSNIVVGVYADCLGRGPTKARSYMDGDIIVCLLEDTLTKAERRLRDSGEEGRLLELRTTLQSTMRSGLVTGIEGLMKRRVKALISGTQLDPDIASEVFVLGESLLKKPASMNMLGNEILDADDGQPGKLQAGPTISGGR